MIIPRSAVASERCGGCFGALYGCGKSPSQKLWANQAQIGVEINQ